MSRSPSGRPPSRHPSPPSSNRGLYLTLAGVAAVVVGLFVVAMIARGGGDTVAQTAPVTIQGEPLPPFPQGAGGVADPATDPAVGQVAPTLEGVSFDGAPVRVAADGTPRLVLFLAHWCPHCQVEVTKIQQMVDEGRLPDGVEVVAVSTSASPGRPNYPPSAWLEREGWSSPVLVDDGASAAGQAFGLTSFPYGVYLDGDNRVVVRTAGALDPALVELLLAQLAGT
jgi:thiol-disulfide isomerase/thioredoxin